MCGAAGSQAAAQLCMALACPQGGRSLSGLDLGKEQRDTDWDHRISDLHPCVSSQNHIIGEGHCSGNILKKIKVTYLASELYGGN